MHPSGPRHGPSVNSPSDQSFSSLASAGKNLPSSASATDAARSEKKRTRGIMRLPGGGIVLRLRRRVNYRRGGIHCLQTGGHPCKELQRMQRICKESAMQSASHWSQRTRARLEWPERSSPGCRSAVELEASSARVEADPRSAEREFTTRATKRPSTEEVIVARITKNEFGPDPK